VDRGGADAAEVHEQFAGEVVLLFWGSGEEGGPPRRKRRWLLNEALQRRGGGALRCLRRELMRSIYASLWRGALFLGDALGHPLEIA
jgi:hypothetical protein